MVLNLDEPIYAPSQPPTNTKAMMINMEGARSNPFFNCPSIPDAEFKNIKIALIAAVCCIVAQPIINNKGDNKIPPPIPIIPESIPITAPAKLNQYHLGVEILSADGGFRSILITAISKTMASIFLYSGSDTGIILPI